MIQRTKRIAMKRLLFVALVILLAAAVSTPSQARVSKEQKCSVCHTMHNSQGGSSMAMTLESDFSGWAEDTSANPSLLVYSCIGCHTNIDNADTIVGSTPKLFPMVFNVSEPTGSSTATTPLAGGNFHYILDVGSGDAKGHNVADIKGEDGTLGRIPPGGSQMSSQLRCAGQYGCHGDRSESAQIDAMKKTHHKDDSGGITGASAGLSYRFLDGMLGKEDGDWEQDDVNTSHNEYKGSTDFTTASTMSYFCARCHGNFHSDAGTGTASPWLRHPTDAVLKNSGEYTGYTAYSLTAPVARPDPNIATAHIVTPGTDIIMCLSCHRTHASPYSKMMRWDYRGEGVGATLADTLTGCVVCHTSKN